MTPSTTPRVTLREADARAQGLVPTEEAAAIYGVYPASLPKAMRRVGFRPVVALGRWSRRNCWWHPADALTARARNNEAALRSRTARRGRQWTPDQRAKSLEKLRARVLARAAARQGGT